MKTNLSVLRALLDIACQRNDLAYFMTFRHMAPVRPMWDRMTGVWHVKWQDAARDVWRLKVLNDYSLFNDEKCDWLNQRINQRAALARHLRECTDPATNRVTVEESGMDCDCVTYSGRLHEIEPTWAAYCKLEKDTAAWADGSFSFTIGPHEQAASIEYKSRDNVMEAYEDGHPHHVIARSPE